MVVSVEGTGAPTVPRGPARRGTRRGLLRALFGGAAALGAVTAVSAVTARRSADRRDDAAGGAFDEVRAGRRLRGRPVPAGAAGGADGWEVTLDGRPLHLMRRADGTWLSMVDHYCSYATPLAAARAAADELAPGRTLRAGGHDHHGDGGSAAHTGHTAHEGHAEERHGVRA